MRRAGNLLGTTRRVHPGALAWLSGLRTARISSGVCDSCPGQNTQPPPARRTGWGEKSEGRRARSVEMITQRPTTGSLRSSAIAALVLRLKRSRQEYREGLGRRGPAMEHGGHGLADRHADGGGGGE